MIGYGRTGVTHDFYAYDSSGQVYNGSTFAAWSDGSYTSYRITATETGTSGRFTGTAPSGTYYYELRERGVTLATSYVVWQEKGPRTTRAKISDSTSTLVEDLT